MNDQIVLHQDEDGNYTVDVVGLMYLLKTNALPDGSEVYVVFEDESEESYLVSRQGKTSFLLNTETNALFEVYPRSLEATFFIDVEAGAEIALSSKEISQKQHYEQIHYEEALTRIKNGETVYVDHDFHEMEAINLQKPLNADMIVEGTWFTSQEVKGIKDTPRPTKFATQTHSPETLFDRLELFFEEEEAAFGEKKNKKNKKNKKKKKKKNQNLDNMLDGMMAEFLQQQIIDAILGNDFEIDLLDGEDWEDYI